MSTNPEIMKQIIMILTQRVREIADKRVFKYWVSETRKLARKPK